MAQNIDYVRMTPNYPYPLRITYARKASLLKRETEYVICLNKVARRVRKTDSSDPVMREYCYQKYRNALRTLANSIALTFMDVNQEVMYWDWLLPQIPQIKDE